MKPKNCGRLILLLYFAASGMSAQFKTPTSRPPDISVRSVTTIDASILREYDCKCSEFPKGWRCRQLSAFADYEWQHQQMQEFAQQVLILARKLPNASFSIAVQGVADSQEITQFKDWELVSPACREKAGKISNRDLAQLRACSLAMEIKRVSGAGVSFIDPIDYEPYQNKFGDEYKAVIVHLLGDNGGCR
jgi:hypothetical protein